MKEEQEKGSVAEKMKITAGLVAWFSTVASVPAQMVLHQHVGSRFLGFKPFFAVALLALIGLFNPHWSAVPIGILIGVFVGRCVLHNAIHAWRWFRKIKPRYHSQYPGDPLICRFISSWRTDVVLRLEPAALALAGLALYWVARPLAVYCTLAAFGIWTTWALTSALQRQRLLDQFDRAVEQENFSEAFSELRGQ